MIAMPLLVALLIALAVVVAIFRILRSRHRWRWPLALGQLLAGAVLYLFLFPPQATEVGGALTIVAPGVTSEQLASTGASAEVIALPGIANQVDGRIERAPDLANALRRHPKTSRLAVIGNGLPSRDRAAARRVAIELNAPPLPDGIVELSLPERVQVGTRWRASGRIQATALAERVIELRDPADAIAASVRTDAQGRFNVEDVANASGLLRYSLSVRDDAGNALDTIPLAINAQAGTPLRLLVVAAVPSPELKYLRRWATDAGQVVDSRIGLSDGIHLRDGGKSLIDAASLATSDLLVVDERSWSTLDAPTRKLVTEAIDSGLGFLLRVTAPITSEDLDAWAELGVTMTAVDPVPPSALRDDTRDDALALSHLPYRLGTKMAPLVVSRDDSVVVGWHAQGRGRVGVITLTDSYRYVLAGSPDRHGSLWASVTSTMARARGNAQPRLPAFSRIGERAVICGLDGTGWQVESPDATRTALLLDENSHGCAAYWPATAGAYRLLKQDVSKTRDTDSAGWSFDVLADDQATTLLAAQTQRATRDLATASVSAAASVDQAARIPRVAWLLAWLAVMSLLWWVERRDYHASRN
ncbi:MAG: hypothetical protein WAV67_12765 [Dokdonella sp.]